MRDGVVERKEVETERNKAQLAVDEGAMCLLCFLLSAEAHCIAKRCECLGHTYETLLRFVPCLHCQANGPWANRVRCLSHPSNLPLHSWDPVQGRSPVVYISDLCVSVWVFLPAGYKVVSLLQCVCIQGFSSLDCFYMFIMKVTAP